MANFWFVHNHSEHDNIPKRCLLPGNQDLQPLAETIKDLSGDKNKFKLALKDVCYITPSTV